MCTAPGNNKRRHSRWRVGVAVLATCLVSVLGLLRFGNSQWNRWIFVFQGLFGPDDSSSLFGPSPPPSYTGTWVRWDMYGRKEAEVGYLDGKRHGLETLWAGDPGRRHREANYSCGTLHGSMKFWHENGQLAGMRSYEHGTPAGRWTEYYPSGQKANEYAYVDGGLHGQESFWHPDGGLAHVRCWSQGKPHDGLFEDRSDGGGYASEGRWRWLVKCTRYRNGDPVPGSARYLTLPLFVADGYRVDEKAANSEP